MVKDGRAVLFIHVPKTGGTTIERLFISSGWAMHFREARKKRPEVFPLFRCSPQHYHADLLRELFDVSRFDLLVGMVREPVARFRSEFAMRHTKLDAAQADADRVSVWADQVFTRYADDPYTLDNHLRPQSEFLLPGTEIYRLEDGMDTMVADLNARFDLGLDTDIPHQLRSETRGLPSSAVQVSPELQARLNEFYAADASLGYPAD